MCPPGVLILIVNYLELADETMAGLHQAIREGLATDIRYLAHKWGGASSSCGMVAVVPALSQLERMGEHGDLSDSEDAYAEANRQLARVRQFLSGLPGAATERV